MPPRGVHPDVKLSIELGCILSRNRYTADPRPVIDELLATAGARDELLAFEVGSWIAFYDDEHTRALTTALRALPLDLSAGLAAGTEARRRGAHDTTGTGGPERERRNAPTPRA